MHGVHRRLYREVRHVRITLRLNPHMSGCAGTLRASICKIRTRGQPRDPEWTKSCTLRVPPVLIHLFVILRRSSEFNCAGACALPPHIRPRAPNHIQFRPKYTPARLLGPFGSQNSISSYGLSSRTRRRVTMAPTINKAAGPINDSTTGELRSKTPPSLLQQLPDIL